MKEVATLVIIALFASFLLVRVASGARLTSKPKVPGGEMEVYPGSFFQYQFEVDGTASPQ